MDQIEIKPLLGTLAAKVGVPGSKSITNRALLMAALANGRSVIESALVSDDTRYMIAALQSLGYAISLEEQASRIVMEGHGGTIPAKTADLFVGGSGTAMRFLAGFLTLGKGRYRLDGNARMRQRPIGDLIEALRKLGLAINCEADNGCPPVVIQGGENFEGGETVVDARLSSQFVSALLLPAPIWKKGLRLKFIGSAGIPFITMTISLMERAGIKGIFADDDFISVPGGQSYQAGCFAVEADASSASYFAAAALLCAGKVELKNLARDSVQGDIKFMSLLKRMGARINWRRGSVMVEGAGEFTGLDIDMHAMPDMVPTLAVLAPFATSPTRIRNVAFIRHHESDRIHALAVELERLSVKVVEHEDGLEITPTRPTPAAIETYDDHRIAMSFAIMGLKTPGIRIKDPGCVSKTYPHFFVDLAALG
ncbi:MAG TPA: 3-phosphoshikimate 1-carboxyvinyltransferase [Candidatus Binataceae bacterium]|jgi:3-phosphoshikimate 1-carboxyvinyltransferase|nr:3-phosphoshikimate 1-carboxyvinyltransferase [Candidatus Binataceae bacterium]